MLEVRHIEDPAFDFSAPAGSSAAALLAGSSEAGAGGGGQAGAMVVWVDDLTRPVLVTPMNLPSVLGLAAGENVMVRLHTYLYIYARTHARRLG